MYITLQCGCCSSLVVLVIGGIILSLILDVAFDLHSVVCLGGILHICNTSLRSSSFCKSCELEQTVLALCERVLNSVYLAGRLILLFQ